MTWSEDARWQRMLEAIDAYKVLVTLRLMSYEEGLDRVYALTSRAKHGHWP